MPIPQLKKKNSEIKIITPKKITTKRKRYKTKNFRKKSFFKKTLRWIAFLLLVFIVFGGIILGGAILWFSRDLPQPDKLIERKVPLTTKIYDRSGKNILYEIHGDQKRTFVSIKEIPEYAIKATIAIEDKNFFEHQGFSLWGIFRGVVIAKLRGKRMQGGSTITQQLIKNAILTNERTIKRKIKELILAWRIEKKFTKEEILQLYFNEIPYGSTAYGIEAASNLYFGKSARELTIAESAILAALPQAPTYYSPYGSHKDKLIARQQYILKLMHEQGYLDQQQYNEALKEKLVFKPRRENIIAPHFVMYIKEQLTQKYGEKMVEQNGLQVITTLDLYKQKKAEEAIAKYASRNEKKYNAKNAALVAIDTKTGQIVAMVGSRDYFDMENDGNVNVAVRLRQPGSSLKPLVYATSFSLGYTPETILYDVETNFGVQGSQKYIPHNYDNSFRGPINMRKALAGSLNIPAVKTLYLTGIDRVIDNAQKMGYTTLNDKNRFGLSLVLGGGEVKLLEHVGAYSAFARDGIFHPLTRILEIKDSKGKTIEKYYPKKRRVMDAQAVRLLNSVLSDNNARAYAFGEQNYLNLGKRPVAAKTGTTNDYKDAWTIGYTPSLACGVWVGNNRGEPMKRGAGGSTVAAPIWHEFMKNVLGEPGSGEPIENFTPPKKTDTEKGVLKGEIGEEVTFKIDKFSGKLATEYTPQDAIEEKTFKVFHSILHYVNKDDPLGPVPENPENDPQYKLWEEGVFNWIKTTDNPDFELPPVEYDDLHIPKNQPLLTVLNLNNNQTITKDELFIDIETSAPRGVKRVEYKIDNTLINTVKNPPFDLYWIVDIPNGSHLLKITAYDDVLNSKSITIPLNFKITDKPINIIWLSPTDNQTVFSSSFPSKISFVLSRISRIKKIDLFLKRNASGEINLLSSIIKPQKKNIKFLWETPPKASGFYKIYLTITDINDKKITDKGVLIKFQK